MPKRKAPAEEELDVGEAPTSIDPYATLAVPKDATPEQIRRAYRQAALKHHPDKVVDDAAKASAHERFQAIALAYAVLSDERRRRRYDATGRTDESLSLDADDDFDWAAYYRAQFREAVTEESIQRFAASYRGGDEERAHVLAAYTRRAGSMAQLYGDVMLSDMVDDEPRFRAIIDAAIAAGEVPSFPAYTGESEASRRKRIERARKQKTKEAVEAEAAAEELEAEAEKEKEGSGKSASQRRKKAADDAPGDIGALAAMIKQRQKGREADFFAGLEAKYAPAGKARAKRAEVDEPPEEAFARNAKKGRTAPSSGDDGARTSRSKRAKK